MSKKLLTLDEVRDLRVSDYGPVFFVFLDLGVLKMFDEAIQALEAGIGQVANLHKSSLTF
jgi:hypothetical protein